MNSLQISNNVQNGLSPEVLNIDPQSELDTDEINELKERVLVEWIKVQNIEISNAILSQKSENPTRTNLFQKLALL